MLTTAIFAACWAAFVIGVCFAVDRADERRHQHRLHWLRGDQWVVGKGWVKTDPQ